MLSVIELRGLDGNCPSVPINLPFQLATLAKLQKGTPRYTSDSKSCAKQSHPTLQKQIESNNTGAIPRETDRHDELAKPKYTKLRS